jgi:hypothetical protein
VSQLRSFDSQLAAHDANQLRVAKSDDMGPRQFEVANTTGAAQPVKQARPSANDNPAKKLMENTLASHQARSPLVAAMYQLMKTVDFDVGNPNGGNGGDAEAGGNVITVSPSAISKGPSFSLVMTFAHEFFHVRETQLGVNQADWHQDDFVAVWMKNEARADAFALLVLVELAAKSENPSQIAQKSFYDQAGLSRMWPAISSSAGEAFTDYVLNPGNFRLDPVELWKLAEAVGAVRVGGDGHKDYFINHQDAMRWQERRLQGKMK